MDTKRKIFVVLGAAAVISTAALGGGALFFAAPDNRAVAHTSTTQASSSISQSTPAHGLGMQHGQQMHGGYKDGTYSASSSYTVPSGDENSIKATLTISGGTVTNVSVSDDYYDRQSAAYVDWFEQELKSAVVGKSLANLSPSRIGGASLTTGAFDQTLDTIRNDATA
jgi:uncharacterized protein with FMN-binding domain